MNKITQHIPPFVDTDRSAETAEFDTLDQLFAVPLVQRFAADKAFHRFSHRGGHLIAELREGREWWVVGGLQEPVDGLPEWDGGFYEVVNENGAAIDIPGSQVAYSCGNEVGLKDGRVLKSRRRS